MYATQRVCEDKVSEKIIAMLNDAHKDGLPLKSIQGYCVSNTEN